MNLRYFALMALVLIFAVGCGLAPKGASSDDGHDHSDGSSCSSTESAVAHDDHAGHDHATGDHDDHAGHDHATGEHGDHEGHDHAADVDCAGDDHEGHDHTTEATDAHAGHDHSGAEDHSDEIVFTEQQAKLVGLKIETVISAPFVSVIKTSGSIVSPQGGEEIIVATQNGVVDFPNSILVEGAAISEGQTIITISSENLAEGDPNVRVKVAYDNAKQEWERAKILVVDSIVSPREFQLIELQYANAKTAYDAQVDKITSKGIKVTSPMSGYLKNRIVAKGQYVRVGDPVATVARNQKLQLRAEVSQRYYPELKSIVSANFRTSYSDEVIKLSEMGGRKVSYAKNIDPASYYLPVVFEFNNVGDILAGSFVEVYLLGAQKQDVISIPTTAVTEEQGVYYVYLEVHNETYKKFEVSLGATDGLRIEVLSGLEVGDVVVTRGAVQVKLASASGDIPHGHAH